jgi:hypothetical protein
MASELESQMGAVERLSKDEPPHPRDPTLCLTKSKSRNKSGTSWEKEMRQEKYSLPAETG